MRYRAPTRSPSALVASGLLASSLLAALALTLAPAAAQAQTFARRRVPRGVVSGLEMGIEGTLTATPGGRVLWFVTLYEVRQRRDLHPAPHATLIVTTSFARDAPVQTVQTDAYGRAALEIPIPRHLEGPAHVRVEAVSPRNVRRVFSVDLSLDSPYAIELFVDRETAPPGGSVAVFGRVLDRVTARPIGGVELTLTASASGPTQAPVALVSDARGVFASLVRMPDTDGAVSLSARTEDGEGRARATVQSARATGGDAALWVESRADGAVAAPGSTVQLRVRVRSAEGVPVVGARVSWADGRRRADADEPPRTDAAGVATLRWPLPFVTEEAVSELTREVTVVDPSRGSVTHTARVRVARVPFVAAFAVEGGALAPELAGRVFVRVVTPDGAPLARHEVVLDAPDLGGRLRSTTDDDGVALFSSTSPVRAAGANAPPPAGCGGPTASAATLEVSGHSRPQRLCLPVDPDATLVVRADWRVTGTEIAVEIARRPSVTRAPVEVAVLTRGPSGWRPIARAVLAAPESRASLSVPDAARGELWVRARPILEGGPTARGGGALLWRGPEPVSMSLDAGPTGARAAPGEGTTLLFAVAAEDGDSLLRRALAVRGPVGAAISSSRGDARLSSDEVALAAALLAGRTPGDEAASVVLRDGEVIPQPLPSEPISQGLLRDPWRTRARFVRGRVGRLMRAVEDYVSAQLPDNMADVAIREGRGFRFNHEILTAALESAGLGDETAAALDGEPLDIAALTAMDRAFTFDSVARRLTRERLFRVNVMLRDFVRERRLDLPWARRGDPGQLLVDMIEMGGSEWSQVWPERAHLFDGWGQPFVLRPARGRAEAEVLSPVSGWVLTSIGPDGRAGTGDDVSDPFARVLPTSGLYAEAVGEDVLLARLNGVALGRATVESLTSLFGVADAPTPSWDTHDARAGWGALPAPLSTAEADALTSAPSVSALREAVFGIGEAHTWSLPSERRVYSAIALRFGPDGSVHSARHELVAGAPWVARLTLPAAMRPGERLRLPLSLIRLADAPEPTVDLEVQGGAITARLDGRVVVIEAVRPGLSDIRVRVRVGDLGLESFHQRIRVTPPGSLRARHAATRATPEGSELAVSVPDGASPWRAELVLAAPRALARDPMFEEARVRHPAIVAWAGVMADDAPDPALNARFAGGAGAGSGELASDLSVACALVVWAATDDDRSAARVTSGAAHLSRSNDGDLSDRAAVLAALAPAAPAAPTSESDRSIAGLISRLRQDGWRTLATSGASPALMARVSAALLLADRRDAPGRALFERVLASGLETDAHGRRWVEGDPARPGDGWVGTLAASIAARQLGQDALADELATSAMARLYLAPRLGAEGTFWALAASVYGAFGVDAPSSAEVTLDGRTRTIALEDGVARMPLTGVLRAVVRADSAVLARVESRHLVPLAEGDGGPLRVSVEGTPGRRGERAGYELVVENRTDDAVAAPVVELALPGASRLDDAARGSMERAPGVVRVDAADGAGVARIHLSPLEGGATARVSLPLRWIASGRTRGLATASYDAASPWEIATTADRTVDIQEAP